MIRMLLGYSTNYANEISIYATSIRYIYAHRVYPDWDTPCMYYRDAVS